MNEKTTLAGGCFWCTEAIFTRLIGVKKVLPGYAGGEVVNPTYEQVSSGSTGHVEAIQIEFDPSKISFGNILEVFWNTHDPTTVDRQGADVGPQYRSVIFYHNETQRNIAEESKAKLERDRIFQRPIVTKILPYSNFYVAENYHQKYFENHKDAAYCSIVIAPKIKHLLERYGDKVKEEYKK